MQGLDFINTYIGTPLGYLMWLCYELCRNYGFAIILFTVLTKILLFPINIWVQKNSIKMVKLQPEFNQIAARHVGDRDKIAEEQMALYKREHYRPLVGMIPMLIQIPIILGLISVVYNPLQHLLHMDASVINAFTAQAQLIAGGDLGSTAQLKVIELIQNPATLQSFASLAVPGVDVGSAIASIQQMDLMFLGIDFAHFPNIANLDLYWLFPVLSGLSAFLLCVFQNRENVLQREQGFLGRWGMAIFLTAFSTYFAFIVPAGVGFYWILGNIIAIITLYLLNFIYDPKKYIDYDALEESKKALEESKGIEKALRPTKEQKMRSKADYKRFLASEPYKQLVYYSEKSGFYKYFENQIELILKESELTIHYLTSDPNDQIFQKQNPRIVPYYVDNNKLIPLFMMMDCDVMVCTTPNIDTYHLKRSMVRKDLEYIYTPHDPLSLHMGAMKGAFDHFDTLLCVGQHQINEARALEEAYHLKKKTLVPCGYALVDNLIAAYEAMDHTENPVKKILIAPSWQDGNILEESIHPLLHSLLPEGFDITVRPHPEFVKRYPAKMQALIKRYEASFGDNFRIETDFSSNVTIFTADLLITDWSGIAYEFSYATKKPCLFINTPMKVMNPEYDKISCVPVELSLRDKIGISLDLEEVPGSAGAVHDLLKNQSAYRRFIEEAMEENLFHPGHSAEVAAQYIIDAVNRKEKERVTLEY